ncbi:MAG: SDR family oxidoreductase [Myxococcota bacterium]
MFQPPDLHGRVAIVTGSSRGIGKAVALALARAGCDVCVAAKTITPNPRLPGTIVDTKEEIEALGRRAIAVATDVRQAEQIDSMVQRTVDELGRVDILVNNAGALWWKNVRDTPAKRFDLVMEVNARASFLAARACLPHMIEGKWGHIVMMSPPIDMGMVPGKVAYSISKFGMTMLAVGLGQEVARHGVAANALWPTTMIESLASINFGLGGPAQWRKAEILADATLAIIGHEPPSLTGQALLDEEILKKVGVEDFEPYLCVPGGTPIRIAGEGAVGASFGQGTGGTATHGPGKGPGNPR